jgi:DNA polymerase III alpha subunit (gram-positive type)
LFLFPVRSGYIPDITQIAAVEVKSGASFNTYVVPKKPISLGAQQTTGIVYSGGIMTVHGANVAPQPISLSLKSFTDWLQKFKNVVLMAHNGRKFDFPVLVTAYENCDLLTSLYESIRACVDSLSVMKKTFPDQSSYKQEDLVKTVLGQSYNAHDALADVEALKYLYNACKLSSVKLMEHSFCVKAIYNNQCFLKAKAQNMPTLLTLVANGVCKTTTAENIAGSGLTLAHLRLIFSRDGQDGLLNVFRGQNCEGQPRVTNTKRVLDSIVPKLSEFFTKNM